MCCYSGNSRFRHSPFFLGETMRRKVRWGFLIYSQQLHSSPRLVCYGMFPSGEFLAGCGLPDLGPLTPKFSRKNETSAGSSNFKLSYIARRVYRTGKQKVPNTFRRSNKRLPTSPAAVPLDLSHCEFLRFDFLLICPCRSTVFLSTWNWQFHVTCRIPNQHCPFWVKAPGQCPFWV